MSSHRWKYENDFAEGEITEEQRLMLICAEANDVYRKTGNTLISDAQFDAYMDEIQNEEFKNQVGTAMTYDKTSHWVMLNS